MDLTNTGSKSKLVAVTLYSNGRKVQAFIVGELCDDGKTRVPTKDMNRACRALGAQRKDTISTG
jgi:hypothetical protein